MQHWRTDGTPDGDCGYGGVAPLSSGVQAIPTLPDGKVLVSDTEYRYENDRATLARLRRDGTVNGTFGDNGYVRMATRPARLNNPILVQRDGRIVVAGRLPSEPESLVLAP